MADDAAAPEGKLSGSGKTPAEATLPDGATESPAPTELDVTEPELVDAESAESDSTPVEDGATVEDSVAADAAGEDAELSEAELAELDETELAALNPATDTMSPVKLALIIGVVLVLALGGAVGWLGFRSVESRKASEQRQVFLQVGRQAALNLTTIDAATVDADVQRILDSAAESFYDDFSARTQPFVDVVKQAQSKSVGEVTSAGLESDNGTDAQVLVAITVRTSNLGAQEQEPRAWRMRIAVKQIGDETKVTNVEFVP
jgi:Mce-associated membrane protein